MGGTFEMVALTRIPESTKTLLEKRFALQGFPPGNPVMLPGDPGGEVPYPEKP